MTSMNYIGSPGNFHDWETMRESAREFEVGEAIADRLEELKDASGHGKDEQAVIESALSAMLEKKTEAEMFYRYLFEIWKRRAARTEEDGAKKYRAADAISNLLGLAVREHVSSEVRKEFVEA